MKKFVFALTSVAITSVHAVAAAMPPSDPCASDPCQNGGACNVVDPTTYYCDCVPGWTGTDCELQIDECESGPCLNGECVDQVNGYSCNCYPDWTGDNCELVDDACYSGPCVNGGYCIDEVDGYSCDCQAGYTGTDCELEIDECASDPCVQGDCYDGLNGYSCECLPGFTGPSCDIDIDECESNPCVNGACVDEVNGYECLCDPGYWGTDCQIDIDECASSPCIHGQCIDDVNAYTCDCDSGWTGTNCDEEQNVVTCVTYQRGVNGSVQDSDISPSYGSWAAGSYPQLFTGGDYHHSLFKFDLTAIPVDATIVSAKITLYQGWSAQYSTVTAHQILAPWSEATVSWTNFGSSANWAAAAAASFPTTDVGYRELDVTDLAADWVSGATPNNGVIVEEPQGMKHGFSASESSTVSKRPSMIVCYIPD